jgi:hypothetical protein
VTPEEQPLGLFGPAPGDAVGPTLDALGIDPVMRAQAREDVAGGLRLESGRVVAASPPTTSSTSPTSSRGRSRGLV